MEKNELKPESSNYYSEMKTTINQHIQNKNWQAAYDLLSEELRMPYIPKQIEHEFSLLFRQVNRNLFAEKKDLSTNENVNIERLRMLLLKSKLTEHEALEIINLTKVNLRSLEKEVRFCLNNPQSNPILKTELIICLKNQNFQGKFQVFKNKTISELDIQTIPYPEEMPIFQKGRQFFTNNLKQVTDDMFQTCCTLLEWTIFFYYPNLVLFDDSETFFKAIIYYVKQMHGETLSPDIVAKYQHYFECIAQLWESIQQDINLN